MSLRSPPPTARPPMHPPTKPKPRKHTTTNKNKQHTHTHTHTHTYTHTHIHTHTHAPYTKHQASPAIPPEKKAQWIAQATALVDTAVSRVDPDVRRQGDLMDVRAYVKFKVGGG